MKASTETNISPQKKKKKITKQPQKQVTSSLNQKNFYFPSKIGNFQ